MPKHFTVDSYLSDPELPNWMRLKMEQVRQILLTFPEITEKIRYTVPFYDYCGMLIYLAPYKKTRLVVGFCNGVNMSDKSGVLMNDAGQTQIRHYELFEHKKLNEKIIVHLVKEALRVNQYFWNRKNGIKNKSSKPA